MIRSKMVKLPSKFPVNWKHASSFVVLDYLAFVSSTTATFSSLKRGMSKDSVAPASKLSVKTELSFREIFLTGFK